MAYWLLKSEPDTYSITQLEQDRIEPWNGVRNYQARNMMRDQMKQGDLAFFYHSNCTVPGIVGIMRIAREAYPDASSWHPESPYYDPKSSAEHARWFAVDVEYVQTFTRTLTLTELKSIDALRDMALVHRGNRLSVMPVTAAQWQLILTLE
ncbi:MAG: EVE domain-containing protein [Gammaproteobacteria bacterium]|nr:EVE domain-containing protein [Gammaproteobacteria bacterium]